MTPLAGLTAFWRNRAPRERAMLAVMVAMLCAFAWWYGLMWPLRALRDDAGAHYDRAVAALQVAQGAVATLPAGRAGGIAPAATDGAALQRHVLDSARAGGLAPGSQRTAADGAFMLEFERVPAPTLFAWLGRLADEGLAPSSLRVEPADGRLRAQVGFGGEEP